MPRRDGDWVKTTLATMKPLAERFPDGWTSIGDTAADRVGMCPAQAAGNNWPGWSSVLAARQVGLAAVRTGVLDARDAVRAAVQSLLQDSDPDREFQRVQDWIAGLPRIARLDVADEALRWLVAWRSIGPHVSGPSVVDRGAVQARITKEVTLRASADLLIRPAGAVDSTVYVSLGTLAAPDADRNVAGRLAAVLWLGGTSVDTVVVLHPKSREVHSVDVDVPLVSAGAQQYLTALRVKVNQALGVEQAPRLTGPQCRWCDLRADCAEGQAYLESHPRVSGGLPVAGQ